MLEDLHICAGKCKSKIPFLGSILQLLSLVTPELLDQLFVEIEFSALQPAAQIEKATLAISCSLVLEYYSLVVLVLAFRSC